MRLGDGALRFTVGFFAIFIGLLSAAEHPDFSGNWTLDRGASDFGQSPHPPSSVTDRITQTGSRIRIDRDRDGQKIAIDMPLDGSSNRNTMNGRDWKTTAEWDGQVLVVRFHAGNAESTERWTVSLDGKTLKVARHASNPMGSIDMNLVYHRQS